MHRLTDWVLGHRRLVVLVWGGGAGLAADGGRPGPYAAALPQLEGALSGVTVGGVAPVVTGTRVLAEDGGAERPIIVEIALGVGGVIVVLALVFGSLLALLPLLMAAVAITTTFLLVLGLTAVTEVSFIVQYLVGLIGSGVAIDYSLLVVMRWREERAARAGDDEAVRIAMATAAAVPAHRRLRRAVHPVGQRAGGAGPAGVRHPAGLPGGRRHGDRFRTGGDRLPAGRRLRALAGRGQAGRGAHR